MKEAEPAFCAVTTPARWAWTCILVACIFYFEDKVSKVSPQSALLRNYKCGTLLRMNCKRSGECVGYQEKAEEKKKAAGKSRESRQKFTISRHFDTLCAPLLSCINQIKRGKESLCFDGCCSIPDRACRWQ